MRLFRNLRYASVLFLLALFAAPVAHATAAPSLGAADPFAVLTFVFGRNGIPGPVLTGDFGYTTTTGSSPMPSVSGSTHVADATYNQAETDEHTAWTALGDPSNFPCTQSFAPSGSSLDLSAQDVGNGAGVFPPGVYCTSMATQTVTMSAPGITLSGNGLYIFRFDGAHLATDPFTSVSLTNGASACDVFWLPSGGGFRSTFGHDSSFVGTVFSHEGYDVDDGVTWIGRAIGVIGGTVNMASDDSIAVPVCTPPPPATGTLHIIKTVTNGYGGSAIPSDATIHVKSGAGDVAGSPHAGAVFPGTSYTLNADTYIVSEDSFSGYTQSFSGDCDANGNVTLAAGNDKTCFISNTQNPPLLATLHVTKHVINDDGGTLSAPSFTLHVKGSGGMGVNDIAGSPAAGVESPGTVYAGLAAGTYTVSEDVSSGYAASFSGDCDTNGNVTLAAGNDRTCTITNNDTTTTGGGGGGIVPPATLHVIKIVVNDNGGKAVVSDAVVHVTSGLGDVAGSPHAGVSAPGTSYALIAGTYNVSENFFPGYAVLISGDCSASGNVTLASGDSKTCTITNNDIAVVVPPTVVPPVTPPTIVPATCDVCSRLTYDVYIINPDGTERHTGTAWVRVTDRGNSVKRYSFEDATIDPHNPLYDYNDAVIDVDFKDCKSVTFMFVSSDASWKHKIRIKVSIDGVLQADTLVANDSKAVVGTSKSFDARAGVNAKLACSTGSTGAVGIKGRILLQVQQHGEAWYVHPGTGLRYYMKDGPVAYGMMRNFGLGVTDKDLAAIPSVQTVDELKASSSVCGTNSAANKVKGWILLQVQQHGEAWYVDVVKCRRIYMKDGAAAYTLMRFLGLGIMDADLVKISIGQ